MTIDDREAVVTEISETPENETVAASAEPEFTQEQVDEARAYEDAVRDQAQTLIDSAVEHFTDILGLSVDDALEEIGLQALTRSILLFGMLPEETQAMLRNAPLITEPRVAAGE